jgi:hypothetical protein
MTKNRSVLSGFQLVLVRDKATKGKVHVCIFEIFPLSFLYTSRLQIRGFFVFLFFSYPIVFINLWQCCGACFSTRADFLSVRADSQALKEFSNKHRFLSIFFLLSLLVAREKKGEGYDLTSAIIYSPLN